MTQSRDTASAPPTPPAPPAAPQATTKPVPAAPAPQPAFAGPAPGAVSASQALEAFLRGADLQPRRVDERQAVEIMHRIGQVLREVVLGFNLNLHLRAEQKQALRVPTTTIQPQNNNPFKFSASVDEALTNLLFRDSAEYLPPVDAVRETFRDIKHHQQHVLAAVRAALDSYIAKLDPEDLENRVSNGKPHGLMSAAHKLKYWDLYKDLYTVVTSHQPGTFPAQFLEELSRAYEIEANRAAPAANPRQVKNG
jgi:type VI secretion system protein